MTVDVYTQLYFSMICVFKAKYVREIWVQKLSRSWGQHRFWVCILAPLLITVTAYVIFESQHYKDLNGWVLTILWIELVLGSCIIQKMNQSLEMLLLHLSVCLYAFQIDKQTNKHF